MSGNNSHPVEIIWGVPTSLWLARWTATHHMTSDGAQRWCTFDGKPLAEQLEIEAEIERIITSEFGVYLENMRDV